MWHVMGVDASEPGSPQARANELVHEAYLASTPARVQRLARQALELWPDCTDAFLLLAEQARGPKEGLDLYRSGMDAAARHLGEEVFRADAGQFWSVLSTRPYMRARLGLAQTLWVLGEREAAVGHFQELLRLNPGDNQGVRYLLASALIELGRDDALADLLTLYQEDGSACWSYSAALLAFRREGDSARARRLLAAAKRANRFVPDYVTGRESFPSSMPESVEPGNQSEAIDYVAGFLSGWRATPGAIDWLRHSGPKGKRTPRRAPRSRGPTAASRSRLVALPSSNEVWQAGVRLLPFWIDAQDDPYRPWVIIVGSLTTGLILGEDVCGVQPSPDHVWDKLAAFMTSPSEGPPRRPAVLELEADERWEELAGHFSSVGVRCERLDRLEMVDALVADLAEHVNGRPLMPGLLAMPGVTPEQGSSFYHAAAGFYRRAPWQRIGGSETIKVACDQFQSGPWHAVVFGQMGMTMGIALYDDLENLLNIRDGDATDEQNARATVALSLTYGNKTEVVVADLDAADTHGWEVAAPDAYPSPVRKERGLTMRPPLSWELQLLEATLRAVPEFIASHDRGRADAWSLTVPTAKGPLTLDLSWIVMPESR